MAQVLLVDDDQSFVSATAELLRLHGHKAATADSLGAARAAMQRQRPDLLLLDLMLPDGNGLELLDELKDALPQRIAIITGHPGIKSLIRGVSGPSVSYLTKPIESRDLLGLLKELDRSSDSATNDDESSRLHFGLMIGESPAIQDVYKKIQQVAPTDSTVLIQGESGTGKELVAEAIHRLSKRTGEFIAVNCGAFSRELIASELFGHEKGSFTGAARQHRGVFERAEGGTLFLDEITEMPLELQTHLLRTLETNRILRVGGEKEIPVNARLVAASNRDPAQAVADKNLREDLFFRLSVFPILLPPLRERVGDVRLLADYFLEELNQQHGKRCQFSEVALERLEGYKWPGNIRELCHTVHRAFILAGQDEGQIDVPDRFENALDSGSTETGLGPGRSIRDVEKELILSTLEHFNGDKRLAADTLGVSLKTLYNRLNEYGDGAA